MTDREYCGDWYEEKPEGLKEAEKRTSLELSVERSVKEAKYLAGHIRFVLGEDGKNYWRTPEEICEFSRQVGRWKGYAEAGGFNTSLATADIAVSWLRKLYKRLRDGASPLYDPELMDIGK